MKTELRALKAKIRGFELEAGSIRRSINESYGDKRRDLWEQKRSLGNYTRSHLIAYALLREKSYETTEKSCGEFNKPSVKAILGIIQAHTSPWEFSKWPEQRVKDLLQRSPKPVESPQMTQENTPEEAPKGVLALVMGLFR